MFVVWMKRDVLSINLITVTWSVVCLKLRTIFKSCFLCNSKIIISLTPSRRCVSFFCAGSTAASAWKLISRSVLRSFQSLTQRKFYLPQRCRVWPPHQEPSWGATAGRDATPLVRHGGTTLSFMLFMYYFIFPSILQTIYGPFHILVALVTTWLYFIDWERELFTHIYQRWSTGVI